MAKRYQRTNQKPYIEEEQTTQCLEDTKGAIRNRISKKNRQHNGQMIPKERSETVFRRTDNTMAKRYQRGNQKPYIEDEETTQCLEDTKGAIRNCILKKNRQHNGQKIPKGESETVYRRRTDNTMY